MKQNKIKYNYAGKNTNVKKATLPFRVGHSKQRSAKCNLCLQRFIPAAELCNFLF